MPYYKITMVAESGKEFKGVKEDQLSDIDQYYIKAFNEAVAATKCIIRKFEVVMLTSHAPEVFEYHQRKIENAKIGKTGSMNALDEKRNHRR